MTDHDFPRSFRGYRRSEVDSAIARLTLRKEQLEVEFDGAAQRSKAMQVEIHELHRRVADLLDRERTLSRTLEEHQDRREQRDREATVRANAIILEAEERAGLLKTEAIHQVGELQRQVEQLLGMRAGLTQAIRRITEDLGDAMSRLASSPATAIDRPVEDHLARWSDTES